MGVKQVKAVINGVTTVLTLNSSTGKYEATITAPAKSSYKQTGHYYPVSVTAEDLAGNTTTVNDKHSTLGSNLRLTVKEKVAPIIAITSPTSGELTANNKPTITFNVTDEDSGVCSKYCETVHRRQGSYRTYQFGNFKRLYLYPYCYNSPCRWSTYCKSNRIR